MGRLLWAFTYLVVALVDIWLAFDFWYAGHHVISICFFAFSLWFVFQFRDNMLLFNAQRAIRVGTLSIEKLRKVEQAAREAKKKMDEPGANKEQILEDLNKEISRINNEGS